MTEKPAYVKIKEWSGGSSNTQHEVPRLDRLPPLADEYFKTLVKITPREFKKDLKQWQTNILNKAREEGTTGNEEWWINVDWPSWVTRSEVPSPFTAPNLVRARIKPPESTSKSTSSMHRKRNRSKSPQACAEIRSTKAFKVVESHGYYPNESSSGDQLPTVRFTLSSLKSKGGSGGIKNTLVEELSNLGDRELFIVDSSKHPSVPKSDLVEDLSWLQSRSDADSRCDDIRMTDDLDDEERRLLLRQERFQRDLAKERQERAHREALRRQALARQQASIAAGAEGNPDVYEWDEHTIVGACMKLEKPYLRLTRAPDPSQVRPLHVLQEAFRMLKQKWKSDRNYTYICDQFKSMRQDLTVQRIKNEFTVQVYEAHARIALEKGDIGEYNQCQTMLMDLYTLGLGKGHVKDEFRSYRILYYLLTKNRSDLNALLASLSDEEKSARHTRYAISVRTCMLHNDYHTLFRLCHNPPEPSMAPYLMDTFVERERVRAIKTICKAYRPSVSVRWLAKELGFIYIPYDMSNGPAIDEEVEIDPAEEKEGTQDCRVFLESNGCILQNDELLTKESGPRVLPKLRQLEGKIDIKGQIH